MKKKLRAACGSDCKQCPAYIAQKTDDNALRARTAKEWNVRYGASFKPEDINRVGCLVDGVHSGYCFACPIRACVANKKLPYCFTCGEFKTCQKRKEFEEHGGIKMEKLFEKMD